MKPTVDMSQKTSSETLSSHPNSPLPKSPLSSLLEKMALPSIATSGVVGSLNKQSNQPPVLLVIASTPYKSKCSPSQSKKKGKAVALPPRYSFKIAYSHYFLDFENERLFEKYITCGFIFERPIKLESFRALGIQKLIEDKGWESTVSNIPRFVPKVVHEFYVNLNDNIVIQGNHNLRKSLLRVISMSFPLELFVSASTFLSLKILTLKKSMFLMMLQ